MSPTQKQLFLQLFALKAHQVTLQELIIFGLFSAVSELHEAETSPLWVYLLMAHQEIKREISYGNRSKSLK